MEPPVILFDVDGILLDFYAAFIHFYNTTQNTTHTVTDLHSYDIASGLNIPQQVIVDFHEQAAAGALPLMHAGIPAYLRALREQGFRIVFNTDFPIAHRQKRLDNLAAHGLVYDEIFFGEKETPLRKYYGDIVGVFEDNPRWISMYASNGCSVFVPQVPYLRSESCVCHPHVVRYETILDLGFHHFS